MTAIQELVDITMGLDPGEVSDTTRVTQALSHCWHNLKGSAEGGMSGEKLHDRMEHVRWDPPVLSFVIERHGGAALGSTRAELQEWEVDVREGTASLCHTRHRQIRPRRAAMKKADMEVIANEIADHVANGETDDRIRWLPDGAVHVVVSRIIPDYSAPKETIAGRRRLFREVMESVMDARGWAPLGTGQFQRLADDLEG
jgi:hypothetical protein